MVDRLGFTDYFEPIPIAIGPRLTGAIARICMNMFDARMIVTFQALQMEYELFVRYVDDLRKFMRSIRRGCFWDENKRKVMWSKTKEEEDSLTTGLERTSELLGDMMNSMVEGGFTEDTGELW